MGCYWAQSEALIGHSVLWQFLLFTFLRVCIPYSSLFQRARGLYLKKKYPFLIGAVTGVMCVCVCLCNKVWMCLSAWECARSGIGSSCTLVNFLKFFFLLMPHCEDKYSYINMFCHSPADDWVSCLCRQERERKHLMWTCYEDFTHTNFNWKWRTFFLTIVLRAPVCSLILFDRPLFDLDKKGVREPPGGSLWVWRHFRILFALLGNSRGVAR